MNTKWDKKKFIKYLIWTFSVAWVLQVIASILARQGNQMAFTCILSVVMFAPLLGAFMAKIPMGSIGFKPKFKGNIRYILASWFSPIVFSVLGAVLYYVIFSSRLNFTGKYLIASAGEEVIEQLAAQGISVSMYHVITIVSAIVYAPWINMFFAFGEEAGWRGVMNPMLKDRFGKTKGRVIGGIIWGAWHWPIMILAGYEYGLEYWGAPVLGMVLFCIFTIGAGTLMDVLYEKTNCIWMPSLAHGALNAFAAVPIMFLEPEYLNQLTLGPSPIGFISMLPMLVWAVWILIKDSNKDKKCNSN